MVDTAVALEGVSKSFGTKAAVQNLSVRMPRGGIYGIIGPNGSGKTTVLRMILDILQPDSGEIRVLGGERPGLANNRISYLPEERGLYRKMKVRHQLEYLGKLKGVERSTLRRKMDDWLSRLGLAGVGNQKIETLSKGMAQKIQFIGSILNDPEILILDEPFSGLDPVNLDVLREVILELKQQGTTILFSTHDMRVAEQLCDTILMIYEGGKVLDGSLETLQSDYGEDTIRIRTVPVLSEVLDHVFPDPSSRPVIRDLGNVQELQGVEDPRRFLQMLQEVSQVHYFEVTPPNLHDIFVRIARPTEEEAIETGGGNP